MNDNPGKTDNITRELNSLRNRCRDLELKYEISRLLNGELDYSRLLNIILDKIMEILQAERGFIVTGTASDFEIKVARNVEGEELDESNPSVSRTVVSQVLSTSRPVFLKDAAGDVQFASSRSIVDQQMKSIICVPLVLGDAPYGAIYVENRSLSSCFMEKDLELMQDLAELSSTNIKNALNFLDLRRGHTEIGETLRQDYDFSMIVGKSRKMIEVMELASRVAPTNATVLITGDSGTGKELIARAIYLNSLRKEAPFLTINCGALPSGLLESELFGHVKGSFTGAVANKIGRFEAADSGTIFLDEVGEMPPELQVKILRVLQFGEFEKVGSYRLQKVDVRIIAATNKNLRKMVDEGTFREDLYYRLKIIQIHFPPLRERIDDIRLLINHFIEIHSARLGRPVSNVDPQFIRNLERYPFPGNIRELESIIQRAIILAREDRLTVAELPPEVLGNETVNTPESREAVGHSVPLAQDNEELKNAREEATQRAVTEVEIVFLENALEQAGGNITKAAENTGMNRSLFQRLVKKHDLKVERKKRRK